MTTTDQPVANLNVVTDNKCKGSFCQEEQKLSNLLKKQNSKECLLIENQLLYEQLTACHTNAVTSLSDDELEIDLASMAPLEGFEWRGLVFPEIDCLDLPVQQYGRTIQLKSYRWPVPADKSTKGVIFMLHGYGSCAP